MHRFIQDYISSILSLQSMNMNYLTLNKRLIFEHIYVKLRIYLKQSRRNDKLIENYNIKRFPRGNISFNNVNKGIILKMIQCSFVIIFQIILRIIYYSKYLYFI